MRPLLLVLLLLVGSYVRADVSCSDSYLGQYESSALAKSACVAAGGRGLCYRDLDSSRWGIGITDEGGYFPVTSCDALSIIGDYNVTVYYATYGVCGYGVDSDGRCVEPCENSGLEGSVWDEESNSCVCPEGQSDFLGTDGSYTCRTVIPECTEDSEAFTGSYMNDTPICNYNDFCGDGEAGGLVGTDWVCVPDACNGGTYINGSCISPDDMSTQPSENFGDSDSDGDGVGDSNDGDLDGDGIPNSEDDDMDGDGVSNFDDPSPFDPDGDSGSATAQGGCDVPPTCSGGDAQLCAILKQQWYSMCYEDDEDSYSGDGFYDPDSSEDSESRIGALFTDFKERVVASDMVVAVSDFFDYGGGGACPVYSVDAWVFSITLDQWCSDKIPWDLISGMLFAVALLIGGRIVVS